MAKRNKQSGKKPKPEILMVLVEGESDELAFKYPLQAFLDELAPNVSIIFSHLSRDKDGNATSGGDSTSDFDIYPGNYDKKISERVMKDLTRFEGVYPRYVTKVIQIVDTDGAYVDDSKRVLKHTQDAMWSNGVFYGADEIEVDHVESVAARHKRKRENLDYLCQKDTIKLDSHTVPYSVYFNSCNLEHFLFGQRNTPSSNKKNLARNFSFACQDDDNYFLHNVLANEFTLQDMTYQESWAFIRQPNTLNSLSRFSNLNLMVEELKSWASERAHR